MKLKIISPVDCWNTNAGIGKAAVLLLLLSLYSGIMLAQDYNANVSFIAQKPISLESDIIANHATQDVIYKTEFIDGLGRPVETNVKQSSPAGSDMIDFHVYDATGRETQRNLPFVSGNSGGLIAISTAQTVQSSFCVGLYPNEGNFYAIVGYENSELSRITSTNAPGNSWANKAVTIQYFLNIDNEVQIWNITPPTGAYTVAYPTSNGTYGAGQLYKTITTNEQSVQEIEYKDKDGHLILKKIQVAGTAADNCGGSPTNGWLSTYYVYDDYGNLRSIISPKAVQLGLSSITQAVSDQLCTRTEYDFFNRPIVQKAPGSGEKWMVYDQRGRVVMVQDANMRNQQKWQYIQYDAMDRQIATGLINDGNNITFHQNNASTSTFYPNLSSFTSVVLTQTYYDNYNWAAGVGLTATLDPSNVSNTNYFSTPSNSSYPYPQPIAQTNLTRGMQTGAMVGVLGVNIPSNIPPYLYSELFYDSKGRTVQTKKTTITGTVDENTIQYSWSGLALTGLAQQVYKNTSNSVNQNQTVLTQNTYDPMGRLLTVTKTIASNNGSATVSSGQKTIASYSYDEMGRRKTENLGNAAGTSNPLETRLLDYNVRGWLLGINRAYVDDVTSATGNPYTGENFTTPNPLSAGNYFGFELGYDQSPSVAGASWATQQYTGNVAGCIWKLANDGEIRKYDFTYDNANEMLSATFTQYQNVTNGTFNTSAGVDYSMNVGYDYNGNIQNLNLKGLASKTATSSTPVNQLSYTYATNSNMLMQVQDGISPIAGLGNFNDNNSGVDYGYDGNGNMITDLNRQLSGPVIDNSGVTASGTANIQYNVLNLPSSIAAPQGTIAFFYDAAGNKLEKMTTEGSNVTTTIYDGSFVYQNDVLQFIGHEEGRARLNGSYMVFDYFLKDNLGNVRMVLTDDPTMTANPILEATSYYPTGLPMTWLNKVASGTSHNRYGYQGKEMQECEFSVGNGLNMYDFSARFYDQQLGVWHSQDPDGQFASPYMAMGNNWVNGVDPSGKSFWGTVRDVGTVVLIAAAAYVGVEEVVAPTALSTLLGSAAAANIATGAAIGVGQNVASTLIQDHGWNWNDQFAASVSGAISGAFQSGAMQASIDQHWLGQGIAASNPYGGWFSGVTSDAVGSLLSTSAKTAILGGYWLDNVLGNEAQGISAQLFHNFTSDGFSFKDNGNNLDINDNSKSNWVAGQNYPQTNCNHFFRLNASFNFITNSVGSFAQQILTGNLFSSKPFAGIFDGPSLWQNLLPNTTAGWVSDTFNSWNP